jgi:hypothetical protein
MAISKEDNFGYSVFIRLEDIEFLSREAKNERRGLKPAENLSDPGDDQECVGCPIWIRWACIKCGTCMYWLTEE